MSVRGNIMTKEQKLEIFEHFEIEVPDCKRNILALQNMKHMIEELIEDEFDNEVINKGLRVTNKIEDILDHMKFN